MKFPIFSSFFPISCTFLLLSFANCSVIIENDAVTVTHKGVISSENDRISLENGNVNSRNTKEEIPHIPTISSENSQNKNGNSVVTTTIKTKGRRTKVLENPMDSQLISQFRELSNTNINISKIPAQDSLEHVREKLPPSPTLPPQQQETSTMKLPPQQPHQPIFYEKRRRLMRRKMYSTSSPSSSRFHLKNNTKREDTLKPEGPPGSELEFPFHLSPIEGSLGGLTGLQGLQPLTPVQFIKTLVAVTPFIIPLIFIPLLIFTIGILMIPVTRANVFVDVAELGRRGPSFDLFPSFIANPIKTIGSAMATGSVIPRSIAYEIGSKLLDTEECVERLSCEISERYLSYSNWEQGNWRSVVNRNWISRTLNLFGRNNPAISRIARSLFQSDHDESLLMMSVMHKEKDRYLREKLRRSSSHEICHRYTCQPRTLLEKFILPPSTSTPSSPSPSLVSITAAPAAETTHEEENEEEANKLLSKSENEQEKFNV